MSADGCPAAITSDAPAIVKRVALPIIKPPIGRARYHKICGPSAQLLGLDREARRTEGTIDANHAIVTDHRFALVGRKPRDDRADIVGVAAATAAKGNRCKRPQFLLLVEQAPDEVVERQLWVSQFLGLH